MLPWRRLLYLAVPLLLLLRGPVLWHMTKGLLALLLVLLPVQWLQLPISVGKVSLLLQLLPVLLLPVQLLPVLLLHAC